MFHIMITDPDAFFGELNEDGTAKRICCAGCRKEETMPMRIILETKEGRYVHSADIEVTGEDDWPEVITFERRLFTLDASSSGIVTYTEAKTLELSAEIPAAPRDQ